MFAGGDDFFLIGPWRTAQRLAARMREEFTRYAAGNPDIHFSAGIATQKPGAPIAAVAELANDALEVAKAQPCKNSVTCFDETVPWREWPSLEKALQDLEVLKFQEALSSGYVYQLLQFVDLSAHEKNGVTEAALWRGRFQYTTRRNIVDRRRELGDKEREQLFWELAKSIGGAIESLGSWYRIALFNHLYRTRVR